MRTPARACENTRARRHAHVRTRVHTGRRYLQEKANPVLFIRPLFTLGVSPPPKVMVHCVSFQERGGGWASAPMTCAPQFP